MNNVNWTLAVQEALSEVFSERGLTQITLDFVGHPCAAPLISRKTLYKELHRQGVRTNKIDGCTLRYLAHFFGRYDLTKKEKLVILEIARGVAFEHRRSTLWKQDFDIALVFYLKSREVSLQVDKNPFLRARKLEQNDNWCSDCHGSESPRGEFH
jgi:hypothetical protein